MKRLLLAVIILGGIAAGVAYLSLNVTYQGFRDPVIVDFPKGTSTQAMADQLAQSGVIRYSWQFLMLRVIDPARKLQAGEYRFARPSLALQHDFQSVR